MMLAGFRRLSVGIMWYVEVMVRGIFIQRPVLRVVVVVGVRCVLLLNFETTKHYGQYKYKVLSSPLELVCATILFTLTWLLAESWWNCSILSRPAAIQLKSVTTTNRCTYTVNAS
jgi:hypothetical protein